MRTIRDGSLAISTNVKSTPKIDGVLFESIKDKVLGPDYDLSLVFVGNALGRRLNREHRKKDYTQGAGAMAVE